MAKTIESKELQEELFYERCCGLDVHKKMIVACLRVGRKATIKEFGTMTDDLRELAQWLTNSGCQMTAMESTGSYWKPIYNILEILGVDVIVVNAHHLKNVPGRKTDVKDAEWIAKQLSAGNLRPSFIPDRAQRERRELVRYRKSLIAERAREVNRLQKMMEGANIKLTSVIDNVMSKSSRMLLDAAANGKTINADNVSELINVQLLGKSPEIVRAMDGIMSNVQRRLFKAVLDHIDDMTRRIGDLSKIIEDEMEAFSNAIRLLDSIPGVGVDSAQVILAEIGLNMDLFPTASHLASWAGLCPGNNESAGKKKHGKTCRGNPTLRSTMVQCAQSATLTKGTFFRAQYDKLVVRRGAKRAKVAVAHSMIIAIWHMLKNGEVYVDLGGNYYNQFNPEKKIARHLRQLAELGWTPLVQTAI